MITNAMRVFNKHILNPAMMRLAGRKYWYASVIRHTGRSTGKEYATPVVADRVEDGFVVPLPYGTGVDWLQNVLAAAGRPFRPVVKRLTSPNRKSSMRQRSRPSSCPGGNGSGGGSVSRTMSN